jgi:transcriptional regulator with XRE-family HTH domain
VFLKSPNVFHMGTNSRTPETVSRAVSEELRVLRARHGKESVRDFAVRCGVPYSTLHKTLAGDRMVDVEELHKIAVALGTTASAILTAVESRLDQAEAEFKVRDIFDNPDKPTKRPAPLAQPKKRAARKDKDPDA